MPGFKCWAKAVSIPPSPPCMLESSGELNESMGEGLSHSVRRLKMAGGFSFAVVLMLTIGIGAATTIFSQVEGILLRPLPFHDPGRLVQLGEHVGENPGIGITARDIRAYSTAASAFSSVGA